MNFIESKVMNALADEPYRNQRKLAEDSGCSLGMINRVLKNLTEQGYLTPDMELTEKAMDEFRNDVPRNAIILAAGFGMRMVPINLETPKAFLEVHGERLIERTIRQLHEVGVTEIYVVVGFMKEAFEYLIDDFGVNLIVNPGYSSKNNLHSLALAAQHLGNTYVIPSDVWCDENPYHSRELRSWYLVTDEKRQKSLVRVNRSMELVETASGGNAMIGISYLRKKEAEELRTHLKEMDQDARYDNAFWEDAAYQKGKMMMGAQVASAGSVVEIDTYEQLRELDNGSAQLESDAIRIAADALGATPGDICHIAVLKKGMTNRSFLFSCRDKQYIMRIPGEGTDQLINRREEAEVYRKIQDKKLCDDICYIDPNTGYKITEYLTGARCCNAQDPEDVRLCMERLRGFHKMKLCVNHEFDIWGKIEFYESLWNGVASAYRDYNQTKEQVLSLRPYIEKHAGEKVLTHIDAVPDNFLMVERDGHQEIRLIDWEYAAMQDPHVDLAMFCIYALYDREQVEALIDCYFVEGCPRETRVKIYCYIAACGLLWSNWCEYKRNLGVEFGEYSLRQYRYAKEYYRLAKKEIEG